MRLKCRVYIQEIRILIGIIKKPQQKSMTGDEKGSHSAATGKLL